MIAKRGHSFSLFKNIQFGSQNSEEMGTFTGHLIPGLAFTILGLWHTFNTINSYKKKGPSCFTSTTWFPLPASSISAGTGTGTLLLKHLELYLLFSFSLLVVTLQVLDYPLLTLSFKPENYEHATMFLQLAIYAAAALAVDLSYSASELESAPPFSGLLGTLAASVFAQELFLLHLHSTDHVGLEGHYHWLLQVAAAASLATTVAAAREPRSFVAALLRSSSLLMQGLWFMVMAFALWVPKLVPKGCYAGGEHGAVGCGTEVDGRRAMAMANLQFSWILAGVSIFAACLCLKPDMRMFMQYRQLIQNRGAHVGQISEDQTVGLKQVHVLV